MVWLRITKGRTRILLSFIHICVKNHSFDEKEEKEEKAPVRDLLAECMGSCAHHAHMYTTPHVCICAYTYMLIYNVGLAVLLVVGSWRG